MKIQRHPSEDFIAAYAAGTLDQGQHIAMGTHLVHCPSCRALAVSTEYVGGETLTPLAAAGIAVSVLLLGMVVPAGWGFAEGVDEAQLWRLAEAFALDYRRRKGLPLLVEGRAVKEAS